MTKASDSTDKEGVADFSADFGRLAAEMLENARALPVPSVMVNPAAAMAAATAIGFGFSTQMAGAFFGALQGALDATSKLASVLDETPPDEGKPQVEVRPERAPARKVADKVGLSVVPVRQPNATPEVVAKPASGARKADDLKQISGVGPKIEQVLNARGIRSFAIIAGWSDEDAAHIDAELGFDGRIARDGWVAQAKALIAKGRKRK
ncbi:MULTISPECIES: NADH-ubiquinone oxidoreductase [Rhizobium]|uniref:NADH-ubiquinone oxidoreductase n=1 Tax=Rhizobium TaxID=379 RepID=UPI00040F4585|nr:MULTISPECIES: NADH-ubiquinone oxidoreductase [Rhizobium]UFS81072.1 5' DNA nuclease [Rhizobium sp. T136]